MLRDLHQGEHTLKQDVRHHIVPHFVTAHVIDTSSFDRRGTTELLDLVSNPTLINCEKK